MNTKTITFTQDNVKRILVLNVRNRDGIIDGEGQLAEALKARQDSVPNTNTKNQTVVSWEYGGDGHINHCHSLYNHPRCQNSVKVLPSTNLAYPEQHLALFNSCGL
jgi:hypothetical protein